MRPAFVLLTGLGIILAFMVKKGYNNQYNMDNYGLLEKNLSETVQMERSVWKSRSF